MKKILTNKLYLTLLGSDLLSNLGDVLYYLVLMNYVLLLPDASFALSLISLSEMVPLFVSIFLGYVADRTPDKVRMIIATQVFRALLYIGVGLAMSFTPALWIVLLAIGVNLLSDLAGQYENGLYAPVSLRVVANEDREAAMGFSTALILTGQIVFNPIGALLLTFMAYHHLAFVNAGTFALAALIMLGVRPRLNQLLKDKPIRTEASSAEKRQGFIASIRLVVTEMFKIPEIRGNIILIPVFNGLFSGISVLLTLMMSQDKTFVLVNSAVTLAAASTIISLGGIIGSILVMSVFKKLDISGVLRLTAGLLTLLYASFLLHNIYLMLLVLLVTGLLLGAVLPKFNALIYNSLPEDKLALITSGMTTYFGAGTALFQLLMSGLVLIFSADQISLIYLILSVGLVLYTVLSRRKT